MTTVIDGQVENIHGETEAFDKHDTLIREGESFEEFAYWKITISSHDTDPGDRMEGWTEEEKICIIGAHEAGHIGRIVYADTDHTKMITYGNELRCRFQYSELYPLKSTPRENWLENYNNSSFFGRTKVNEYYKDAIDGLVKAGKITKEEGQRKKSEFINANSGQ